MVEGETKAEGRRLRGQTLAPIMPEGEANAEGGLECHFQNVIFKK